MRMALQSIGIFVCSMIVLGLVSIISNTNTGKASGPIWFNAKGYVLMGVGVLYLLVGFLLTRWH